MITLWIFQVDVAYGSGWRGNDDIISLSTLQGVHWVWEENARTVLLLHTPKGWGFSYQSVGAGYTTVSAGSRAAQVTASYYAHTMAVPHWCLFYLGFVLLALFSLTDALPGRKCQSSSCLCWALWRVQIPEAHCSHSQVGKTKCSTVIIIRKLSRAKSCGIRPSGDQRRKKYGLQISESKTETMGEVVLPSTPVCLS